MGAYCKFCGHRCFVVRTVPEGPWEGWTGCMATCPRGMEHDRLQLGGYDHITASSPFIGVPGGTS